MDLTQYKIKDIYTNNLVRVSTPTELHDWLWDHHATKSESLGRTIRGLCEALMKGEDYTGHAAANGLEITPVKKTRRKAK